MRGRHELDIHLDGWEMAGIGQGAVQGEEINLQQERPSHLPLGPGAVVLPPPGSEKSETGWRTWIKEMDPIWASLGRHVVSTGSRKRTLSESSCISNVSFTPRKRRISEDDIGVKVVPKEVRLIAPSKKYQVNPKALRNSRPSSTSSFKQLQHKQILDTENGLDLGELLQLEYPTLEGNRSEENPTTFENESRACKSKNHGRGWCKFGDNCVVRRKSTAAPKDRPRDQDEEEQAKLIIEEVKCEVKVERECAEERISMLGVTFEKEQSRPGKCNMAGKSQFSRHSTGSSVTEVTGTARGNNDTEQVSCLIMLVI